MTPPSRKDRVSPPPDLEQLLRIENAIADRLDNARREARRLVEEARTRAEGSDAEAERELLEQTEALRRRVQEEKVQTLRAIREQTRETVRRFETFDAEHLDELGEDVLERLFEPGKESR